jgi:hypothetical protein
MIDLAAKNAFWDVVEDCLVNLHGLQPGDARQRAQDFRARIESPPTGMSSDIFYHNEPFDVACDLADNELDRAQYRAQYDSILGRHNW